MQPRNTLLLQSAGKSLHCWQHLEKPFFSEELCLPHLLEDSGLVWQRKYTADMPECFITHCTWPGTDGIKTVMMSPVLGYVLCALLYSKHHACIMPCEGVLLLLHVTDKETEA